MPLNFNDFQKQDISFDISELRNACDEVLKIKGFDTSLGIPHFAGISLNQIPGKPESITGNYIRGVFWTRPEINIKPFFFNNNELFFKKKFKSSTCSTISIFRITSNFLFRLIFSGDEHL